MRSNRWVFAIFLSAFTAVAQQNPAARPPDAAEKPSTVTGHVYLSDTKGPARKATVYLHSVAALEADTPPRRGGSSSSNDGEVESIGVQTRLDGSFSFDDIKPGNYYVIGEYSGYISPYLSIGLAKGRSPYGEWQPLNPEQQAATKAVFDTIPRLTVQSDRPATIDITLERGGAISGNVAFDDGNPAAGLEVTLLSRMLQDGKLTWSVIRPATPNSPFVEIKSDDRGDYRFSGLPAGKYMVRMELNQMKIVTRTSSGGGSSSMGSSDDDGWNPITIYSGDTPNSHKAQSFDLSLGDEHTGEDFRIPVSRYHTVTGTIVSARDGHAIRRGKVELVSTDGNESIGEAQISEDHPEFAFHFVHDGDYQLSTGLALDIDPSALSPSGELEPAAYDSPAVHLYGNTSMPLHVNTDMSGVTLALPEATPEELQAFKDAIHQHEPQNQTAAQN
jgi:hypothetical protein